jgi:hypothetical protein
MENYARPNVAGYRSREHYASRNSSCLKNRTGAGRVICDGADCWIRAVRDLERFPIKVIR